MELHLTDKAHHFARKRGGVVLDHIKATGCGMQPELTADVPRAGRDLSDYHHEQLVGTDVYRSPSFPTRIPSVTITTAGAGPFRRLVLTADAQLPAASCSPTRVQPPTPHDAVGDYPALPTPITVR